MNCCLQCNFETKNPKFCSRSCAATFNNLKGKANRRKPEGKCGECGQSIRTRKTWCDECLSIFSISPPRKSRTFPTGLEGPCQDPLVGGKCSCGSIINDRSVFCKSCSARASGKLKAKKMIKLWISGDWRGGTDYRLSEIIRNYLLEQAKYSCQKCGFNTSHPDDNRSVLEINHIDGNGLNHSIDNLEVICPNCHALTSTYRGRNIGKGRPISYIRKISK